MDQILANNVETFGDGNAISVNTRQASMDVVCDRDQMPMMYDDLTCAC